MTRLMMTKTQYFMSNHRPTPHMSRPEQGGWGNRERGARSRHRTSDDDSCKDDRTCTHEKDMTEDSEGYYPSRAPVYAGPTFDRT